MFDQKLAEQPNFQSHLKWFLSSASVPPLQPKIAITAKLAKKRVKAELPFHDPNPPTISAL